MAFAGRNQAYLQGRLVDGLVIRLLYFTKGLKLDGKFCTAQGNRHLLARSGN